LPGTAIAASVGNSTIRLGLIRGVSIECATAHPVADIAGVVSACQELLVRAGESAPDRVILASVNPPAAEQLTAAMSSEIGLRVERFGAGRPIPIAAEVPEPARVGQDRLLASLGAFALARQACVVVDAGTALTVNFIDGAGVFHGGAIIPGGQMMLDALHERTAGLPGLRLAEMPEPLEPFGRVTEHAMLLGVRGAVRGAVRYFAEAFAEYYEAYPRVVATGGAAEALLGGDELIEAIVPELVLIGIAHARARLAELEA
jgi:type III pantothenate kinase